MKVPGGVFEWLFIALTVVCMGGALILPARRAILIPISVTFLAGGAVISVVRRIEHQRRGPFG